MSKIRAQVKNKKCNRAIVSYLKAKDMVPLSEENQELESLFDLTIRSAKMKGVLGGPIKAR
jgi:hypothetical protein